MPRTSIVASLFLVLLLTACSSVRLSSPLPQTLNHPDAGRFEGNWSAGDGVVSVRLFNGTLKFAALEWKNDQFEISDGEMTISRAGNSHNLISLRLAENGKLPKTYYFARYRFTDQGDLVFWPPKTSVFEAAVEKKKLLGKISKGKHSTDLLLTDTPEKVLEFISREEGNTMFEYLEPIVFKRVGAESH